MRFRYRKTVSFWYNDSGIKVIIGVRHEILDPERTKEWKRLERQNENYGWFSGLPEENLSPLEYRYES